ncbi:hypothetical protein [Pseudomonas qingdaonensis]|uniref:hypothetical protein n=1 Tax=Pseudomonas qingdaonensis TaxID=2056231 RepID=UPI000C282797|nr:hypothetical protein [Pseudomonas qingdaonensis]
MKKRKYPFTAWVLGGTFIPKEVEFIKTYWGEWHEAAVGKNYHDDDIFPSKADAVAHGHKKLAEQEAKIAKQQTTIAKKRANLDKHDDSAARVKP